MLEKDFYQLDGLWDSRLNTLKRNVSNSTVLYNISSILYKNGSWNERKILTTALCVTAMIVNTTTVNKIMRLLARKTFVFTVCKKNIALICITQRPKT